MLFHGCSVEIAVAALDRNFLSFLLCLHVLARSPQMMISPLHHFTVLLTVMITHRRNHHQRLVPYTSVNQIIELFEGNPFCSGVGGHTHKCIDRKIYLSVWLVFYIKHMLFGCWFVYLLSGSGSVACFDRNTSLVVRHNDAPSTVLFLSQSS